MREAVDTKSREATELKDKLKEAEEIIDLLQRQVNIKDEELAALQARLAELGVKTEIPAAAPTEAAKQQLKRQGLRLVARYATIPILIALGVLALATFVVYVYYLMEDKCGWCIKVFHALPGV